MNKLFKRILVSTFAIGASLFIGNKVFAENYKVNIAVVGDNNTGKTQILNRIFGLPFEDLPDHTNWDQGAGGRQTQYHLGDDVFECYYYDAPGYLRNPDATLDQQIDSAAIRNANIALIVIDPQQTEGMEEQYLGSSFQEAFVRHATHVFKVNPNCKIIVVANKKDKITDLAQLARYEKRMQSFRETYDHLNADSIFTSAKTDKDSIAELESKITNLLVLNKAQFPTFDNSFVVCQRDGCGRRQRVCDGCKQGFRQDWYCGEGCLRIAEAKSCERPGCPNRERFLRCRGEGFTNPRTGKMYCGIECYKKDVGEKCAHKGCDEWFVIADGTDGVDFFTNPKNGKMYCPKHSEDATPGCTLL